MITIETPEQLFQHLITTPDSDLNLSEIKLGNGFIITITIKGDGWDEKFDYKAAQLLLNVQKDLLKIVSETTGENFDLRTKAFKASNLRITAQLKKGSRENVLDYAESALEAIKMLPSHYQMILFSAALVGTFGYLFYRRKQETKEKLAELASHDTVIKAVHEDMSRLVEKSLDIAESATKAPRYLASKINDDDVIVTPAGEFNKKSAKENLPASIQEESEQNENIQWVDDDFMLQSWGIAKANLSIKDSGNNVLNAKMEMMIPDEMAKLKELLPAEMGEPTNIKARLRVAVILNSERRPVESFLLQVNPKENDYPTLSDLLAPDGDDQKS